MRVTTGLLATDRAPRVVGHFRPDIQGLRAIAVLTVLFFHGTDGIIFPGGYIGVDIFFVISGFLITGHLLRVGIKEGRIYLVDFYARRARRILPAATVVLIFVAITTVTLLPATRWKSISNELIASALYLGNWQFARTTDYLNAEVPASPVQHYWTLAVEEQFYILWPAMLLVVLYFVRLSLPAIPDGRGGAEARRSAIQRYVAWVALVMTASSLAFSIVYSEWNAERAYFVTPTRLWEMGIGATVAAFAVKLERVPDRIGYLLGAMGLSAIIASAILYDSQTVFPGYAALLPTLGAAAVIIGGMAGRAQAGVGRLLGLIPMRWIGDLSYSLYLWHWPLIVLGTYLLGGELGASQGLIIVAISFIPAWLSYRCIENPVRDWSVVKSSAVNALKMGAALMVISVLAGVGVRGWLILESRSVEAPDFGVYAGLDENGEQRVDGRNQLYGAETVSSHSGVTSTEDKSMTYYPAVSVARQDAPVVAFMSDCRNERPDTNVKPCVLGDSDGEYIVAMVGDSHMEQWVPAFDALSKANGWRLEVYAKSWCPMSGTALGYTHSDEVFYPECYEWSEKVLNHLKAKGSVDHVVVSGTKKSRVEPADPGIRTGSVAEGYALVWEELVDADVPMTILLDTPYPRINIPECVNLHESDLSECAVSRSAALDNGSADLLQAAQMVGLPVLDMTRYFCTEVACPAVIGDVMVYRDSNHMSATYARSLTALLERELRKQGDIEFLEKDL